MSKRSYGPDELIFRLKKAAREMEPWSGLDKVDLTSRAILDFIGECAAERRPVNVTDIVKTSGFGTPPTVYKRLAVLENTGWIQTKPHPVDGRVKLVEPTAHTVKTYRKMSSALQKVL